MKNRIPHYCPESDYAYILPDSLEYEACLCIPGREIIEDEGNETN